LRRRRGSHSRSTLDRTAPCTSVPRRRLRGRSSRTSRRWGRLALT
jgi:hypothetical protein